MLRKTMISAVIVSAFAFASTAQAGRADLTAYYPLADGQYATLSSTGQSSFATTPGAKVGIGTTETVGTGGDAFDADLTITGSIVQDAWTHVGNAGAPAFLHSWVNCTTWAGYNTAAYFRDKNGIVHLKGFVSTGAFGAAVTLGVPNGAIFRLPEGFRPARRMRFAVMTSFDVFGRCDIDPDGYVIAVAGSNVWFSLDGITFRAAGY